MALFGQSTAFGSAAPVAAPGGAFGSTLATAAATNPMKDIALNNCPGRKKDAPNGQSFCSNAIVNAIISHFLLQRARYFPFKMPGT